MTDLGTKGLEGKVEVGEAGGGTHWDYGQEDAVGGDVDSVGLQLDHG